MEETRMIAYSSNSTNESISSSRAEQELHQNLNKKINGQARYELECIKLWGSN